MKSAKSEKSRTRPSQTERRDGSCERRVDGFMAGW
jgi:hypothetical protein